MSKGLILEGEIGRKLHRWAPPHISPTGEVIRSPDAVRQAEIDTMVATRVAELKATAQAEGYAAGHQQGRTEGQRAETARMVQLMNALANPLIEREAEVEAALLNLVIEISRALIQHELTISGETILAVVRQAVAALPKGSEQISLSVHPEERELLLGLEQKLPLTIEADPRVTRGGCRIESRTSSVDFTSQYRFRELIRELLGRELSEAQSFIDPEDDPAASTT